MLLRSSLVRRLPVLLGFGAGMLLFATPAQAADPLGCTGYPEPRRFQETQGWWTPPGTAIGGDSEHIHVGLCFPEGQTISGVTHADVRVVLHNVPASATFRRLRLDVYGAGQRVFSQETAFPCTEMTCVRWWSVDIDTRLVKVDGWQEFRWGAVVTKKDKSQFFASTRFFAYLQNGKKIQNYDRKRFGGAGYYTGAEYTQVRIDPATFPAIGQTVSGIWSLKYRHDKPDGFFLSVDPDFHGGSAGTVLAQGTGGANVWKTLAIDTRQFSNGEHKLFVRTDDTIAKPAGTNSGAVVLPFVVNN
jgi:hypothetical protein